MDERTRVHAGCAQPEGGPASQRARAAASFMIENLESLSELVSWWEERKQRGAGERGVEKKDRPSRGYRIERELVERVRELSRDQGRTFEDALNLVIVEGLRILGR